MKAGDLVLRRFLGQAEHLARSGEIETAFGRQRSDRRQQKMGAVDVDVQSGEFVVERVADEALGRQVVALVRLHLVDHPVDAGEALERCGVELQAGKDSAQRDRRWSGSPAPPAVR